MRVMMAILLVVSLAALVGAAEGLAAREFPVCTYPGSVQQMPVVSGSRIVWCDQRGVDEGEEHIDTANDIYVYDFATGVETAICTEGNDQVYPSIDGDRIVWRDDRSGQWEIWMHDLSTGITGKVADAPTGYHWEALGPDISGEIIVWADDHNHPVSHNLDVYMYDLSTETQTRLTEADAQQGYLGPRVHGGKVVWLDFSVSPIGDIRMYDVGTETVSVVSGSEPMGRGQVDIWGDIVVWTQATGEGNWGIWYRDLAEVNPAELGEREYVQDMARVGGRWVTWLDDYVGGGDQFYNEIRVYDLEQGAESGLTESAHPYSEQAASVSDSGLVVWMDWRNGDRSTYFNPDIYGYVLTRFWDVLANHWAYDAIEGCVEAEVVSGYLEGDYRPSAVVTRDQMAVYIARALAGGDGNVPEGPETASFEDVPNTGYGDSGTDPHWAYKYVEYAVDCSVVQGYAYDDPENPGETIYRYEPTWTVTRDQMAVYVARAMVAPTGEAALEDYVPSDPRNFPDVPNTGYGDGGTDPFWAYTHIEYCVENGVVSGYDDGYYRPEWVVTRDQMAVYVARAFGLGG